MKHLSRLLLPLTLVLLLFSQCRRPHNVLSEDKMKAILHDMLLVDVYTEREYQPDSVVLLYYESVLAHHGVSRATYDSSLVWYGKHAPILQRLYEDLEQEVEAHKAQLDTLLADSLHYERPRYEPQSTLWAKQQRLLLHNRSHFQLHEQSIGEIHDLKEGDTLLWQAVAFPPLQSGEELLLTLYLKHDSGTLLQKLTDTIPHGTQLLQALFLPTDLLPGSPVNADLHITLLTHPDSIPLLHLLDRLSLKILNKETEETLEPDSTQIAIPKDSLITLPEDTAEILDDIDPKTLESE